MEDRSAQLQIAGRRDGVQILDGERHLHECAPAFHPDRHRLSHGVVQNRLQHGEVVDPLPLHAQQDVAGLEKPVGSATGNGLGDDQHADGIGKRLAHRSLGLGSKTQASKLVVGLVAEDRLDGSAGHWPSGADQIQGADDAVQGQKEARGGGLLAAGVEPDHPPAAVDDRRAGRSAGGARGRLDVEGVEVVVAVPAVAGRLSIQARDGAGQDRQLLPGIVSDHADLGADMGALGSQRQLAGLHEPDLGGVEAIETEVVHRIPVDRPELDLLVVQEERVRPHRTRLYHVPIGQDQTSLRIHHESRRDRIRGDLRIEWTRGAHPDRKDARHHAIEHGLPALGRGSRALSGERQQERSDGNDSEKITHGAGGQLTEPSFQTAARSLGASARGPVRSSPAARWPGSAAATRLPRSASRGTSP